MAAQAATEAWFSSPHFIGEQEGALNPVWAQGDKVFWNRFGIIPGCVSSNVFVAKCFLEEILIHLPI